MSSRNESAAMNVWQSTRGSHFSTDLPGVSASSGASGTAGPPHQVGLGFAYLKLLKYFLDPLLGSYVTSSVRPSVSPSVTKVLILPVISFLRFFASSYSLMSLKKWRSPIFEKKLFGPKMAKNGQNLAQNEVFGHFLEIASLVLANFAYDDRQAWCLTDEKYFGQILRI